MRRCGRAATSRPRSRHWASNRTQVYGRLQRRWMEFRILGPLEVVRGDRVLRLGSGRQLALVAVLLLHANEAVSVDRLVEELWGESAPPTAAKIVRNSVSLLRRALGDGEL